MITFDGIVFSSVNRLGGVSVYFKELIRRTSQTGEGTEVLVHGQDITEARVGAKPGQVSYRTPRVLERYRSLSGVKAGLLHSSYYRTSVQRNVRNVVTVYDFTYERTMSGIARIVHSAQKRAAINRADAVLCISESTRRDLFEFLPHCAREKVFVTHLGAGEEFKPLQARPEPSRPFVLFVSGRVTYKNFDRVVDALSFLPDVDLVCVGGGAFSGDEKIRLQAALPGRYRHTGPISPEALNEIYNDAMCLVYPSLYEGFGIPLLEAMNAGCPFIALNRSSIPEVAGNAGILLQAVDARELADAILECARHDRRQILREAGFAQARLFSWDKTYAETSVIYQQLKSGAGP